MESNKRDDSQDDKNEKGIGEIVKKVVAAGVSAAFVTEDYLRTYLSDVKMPKELLTMLLQQANKSKEEIVGRVTKEVVQIIKHADLRKEVEHFVENHKFKISAEVEILKKKKDSDHSS